MPALRACRCAWIVSTTVSRRASLPWNVPPVLKMERTAKLHTVIIVHPSEGGLVPLRGRPVLSPESQKEDVRILLRGTIKNRR